MSVYFDSIPAVHLSGLIHHLLASGQPCAQSYESILAVHNLSLAALDLPHARLSRKQMASVLMDLMAHTGRTDLGFEMGLQADLRQHPLLGQLLLSSRTLGECMQRMAPYMPLVTPSFRMQCDTTANDGLAVNWLPVRPLPYDMARLAIETILMGVHHTCQQLFPTRRTPMVAHVTWPAPAHAQRYAQLRDFTIQYQSLLDQVGVRLDLPPEAASMALPRSDAQIWLDAKQACASHLQRLESMHHWADWIAHILDAVEDHQPSQAELAGLIGISGRTLARHLASEGVRFRDLVLGTRHRRACKLLAEPGPSVAEIARILGYNDSANFSRAFRAQEGCAPAAYRQAHRPGSSKYVLPDS